VLSEALSVLPNTELLQPVRNLLYRWAGHQKPGSTLSHG
jgi:hypothetical protein